ncbi:uncharacterized protein LOC141538178 [Cotesia typhae]|uniref:uncharacterized protein LOC141538178 n=1 Tax=Cotesia typhae TaxID=2053667 RepID=UPI003D69A05D
MKFKIWIILLFATSGHGFLRNRIAKLHSWISGSDQGPADVSVEEHQRKTWETQQSASSNHRSYGNSNKENFEQPGVVHHESFNEPHSEVYGADSGGILNLGLSVNADMNLNSYGKISKVIQSGTNLRNKLQEKKLKVLDFIQKKIQMISSERSKEAETKSQRDIWSQDEGSYRKSAYGEAVSVGQDLNNQESASYSKYDSLQDIRDSNKHEGFQIKHKKYSDSDSKYYGYDSKSTSFDEDSSSEEFDGQYQSQDQELSNSDTDQYQEHETGLSFGLNDQNYDGFNSDNEYGRYPSGNRQLVSSYASGHQGYGSEVQSNGEQGHSDGKTIEQLLYELNQNQYNNNNDQIHEQFLQNDYSQSQSSEEPEWSEQWQDNDFVDHTVKVNTNLQNLKHSISNYQELENYSQFNSQTHGYNVTNDKNEVVQTQEYENGQMGSESENGAKSNFVYQPMHSGVSESLNHKLTINSAQYDTDSDSMDYQYEDLDSGFNNQQVEYQQQDDDNPIELYEGSSKYFGHPTKESFGEVETSHGIEESEEYGPFTAGEHKSSYGYKAHSSETGYGNHNHSEGVTKYEQQGTVDSYQIPLTSDHYSQSKVSSKHSTLSESGNGHL